MGFIYPVCSCQPRPDLKLWYTRPAERWEETLPLGNGRLGMMPDGGVVQETIVLNDITMWSGSFQDTRNPEALKYLPEIRTRIGFRTGGERSLRRFSIVR